MGGDRGGPASDIALEVLREQVARGQIACERGLAAERPRNRERRVRDATRADPALRGAGCTIACVYVADRKLTIAWLGDVRLYRSAIQSSGC